MIQDLPIYIPVLFLLIAIYVVFIFTKSNQLKKTTLPFLLIWGALISILAYNGFYQFTEGENFPAFAFLVIPMIFFIIYLVRNKSFYQNRDFRWSTAMHVVRFPAELLLFQLGIRELIPMEMTYEGWNFDIIPGITSILILLWMKFRTVSRKFLLVWNILGLIFILFIFSNGFLSQELLYKNFGYSVPNRAIAYFPMILLGGIIVPLIVFTHISDIILLSKKHQNKS